MKIQILVLALVHNAILFAQDLKPVLVNESIKVSLPQTFVKLTDGEVKQSYKSYRKPIAIYRDQKDMVDFGVNFGETEWPDSDLEIFAKFQKASIKQMFTQVKFLNEGFEEVKGRNFAFFEFESEVKEDEGAIIAERPVRKYILTYYTIVNGKILLFQFNSPILLKDKWRKKAQEIMKTITVSKSKTK